MTIEEKLEREIENAIRKMKKFGYIPTYFNRMRETDGSIIAIKKLLQKDEISGGLATLWENNSLDLCMESIIQNPEYKDLFTSEEIKKAKKRIDALKQ